MGNKEKLKELLAGSGEEFISGSVIAHELGISRAGVWKNIRLLEKEGYRIEAVNNKGYRFAADNDIINVQTLKKYLGDDARLFRIEVFETTDSTNNYLKMKAEEFPGWSVAVAGHQSAGKGRAGRSFYSPRGTGLYLSVLLKEHLPFSDAGKLTTAAAVAACRAIEACCVTGTGRAAEDNRKAEAGYETEANRTAEAGRDHSPKIKWVNDVFVNGKKVCGILTEASVGIELGIPDWLVTGIGFNVFEPEGGFPADIAGVAGAITDVHQKDLRSRLAAAFIKEFYSVCADLQSRRLYEEYKKRCFIPGKRIFVLRGEERIPAEALDINEDFALLVRYEDGTCEALRAGEVSIRPELPEREE